MESANKTVRYSFYHSGIPERRSTEVIVETPVSLTVNGELWLTFMCTPVDLEALGVGFLYNEGLINENEEIASVRLCSSGENIDVWLNHALQKPASWRRTSGCTGGVTSAGEKRNGKGSAGAGQDFTSPQAGEIKLSPGLVGHLVDRLFESQDLYRKAGGVHTSALSDGQQLIVVAEDIGRHNTLDKIAGRCLLEGIAPERRILLTTGRVSSEMLQKSARLGASIVISRTSPSSLSIEMAERWGVTLIGYARRNQFNAYTHPERIADPRDLERSCSLSRSQESDY